MSNQDEDSFFMHWVGEVIFFSGDVKTTTIAIAITGSLCCSIVWWVVQLVKRPYARERSKFLSNGTAQHIRKSSGTYRGQLQHTNSMKVSKRLSRQKSDSSNLSPCSKCKEKSRDKDCTNYLCMYCCHSNLLSECAHHRALASQDQGEQDKYKPRTVNLSYVGLDHWPERLGFVGSQLSQLNLSYNRLSRLPDEIGCLRGLEELWLQHNTLTDIPGSIQNLSRLKELDLSNNCLKTLPDIFDRMTPLIRLGISSNMLEVLPDSMVKLVNLEEVHASSNDLKTLPVGWCGSLLRLQSLLLSMNKLKTLPQDIGNLVRLEELDVSGCYLTTLPVSVTQCRELISMNLSHNRISRLPDFIGNLHNLRHLNMNDNKLKYFPFLMVHLILDKLLVSGNPLLTQEDKLPYQSYSSCSSNKFSSLLEMSLRAADCSMSTNYDMIEELPNNLRELLEHHRQCLHCTERLFLRYNSRLDFIYFAETKKQLPLYQEVCANSYCSMVENTSWRTQNNQL